MLRAKKRGIGGRSFFVVSGTGIAERRERAPSASEALRLIRKHMELRRPGVRVEDVRGCILL
jgi:hypothetical protein